MIEKLEKSLDIETDDDDSELNDLEGRCDYSSEEEGYDMQETQSKFENEHCQEINTLDLSAIETDQMLSEENFSNETDEGSKDTFSSDKQDAKHTKNVTKELQSTSAMFENGSSKNSSKNKSKSELSSQQSILPESVRLKTFQVPPLLCRHPTPAEGRDDDVNVLRNILQDTLLKLGRYPDTKCKERILFAPDYKIAKNLLHLLKTDEKFQSFLPEFPVLHLKKSKINNLFAAYKEAGIINLLKFMKDEEQEKDWMDLISLRNIETAARNIKRLSFAFHLAFLIRFLCSLPSSEREDLLYDLDQQDLTLISKKWLTLFQNFIASGKSQNATFALHVDMMSHFEIVGISIAERLGGNDGYNLLLSCVKTSLPFAFLNGSTSYASFCTELMHIHYSAGCFHKNMKQSLFTTPHKDSNVNFALDTQREIDHQDAVKGFRPRATMQSVIPRMAVVDHFTEVQRTRHSLNKSYVDINSTTMDTDTITENEPNLDIKISKKDLEFAIPVARLVLRAGALCTDKDDEPRNLYHPDKIRLSTSILDRETYETGKFLIMKFACQQGLFQLSREDIPNISSVCGPKELLQRVKNTKGITLRRSTLKNKTMTEEEKREYKRKAKVKKETNIVECLSSDLNTCQSIVKPDGSKPTLDKSRGVKKALMKMISYSLQSDDSTLTPEETILKERLVYNDSNMDLAFKEQVKYATIEFAGVKFRTKATTGHEYLEHVEKGVLSRVLKEFPSLKRLVLCEEKYSYTPDDFKAATRKKRQKVVSTSISYLKEATDILTDEKLTKTALITTDLGKRLISNYLAQNVHKMTLKHDIILDIDSEFITRTAPCSSCQNSCSCPNSKYTVPVRAIFSKSSGFCEKYLLEHLRQRKGEAEVSQVDWLFDIVEDLKDGETVISVVTSADIDSIIIHMFCIAFHWPRNTDGRFKFPVYVQLQKQKTEIFNITRILETLEKKFGRDCLPNIAISLCLGGNDFLPKFHGFSHEKWVLQIIQTPGALNDLVRYVFDEQTRKPVKGCINKDVYLEIIKQLYCPFNVDANAVNITYESIRQMSIKLPTKNFKHPTTWLLPKSALMKVIQLIDCQIAYLLTVSNPSAPLPDFMSFGCLKKDKTGNVTYDLGEEVQVDNMQTLLRFSDDDLQRIMRNAAKNRKKRPRSLTATPTKKRSEKRRPLMSTPVKKRQSLKKGK